MRLSPSLIAGRSGSLVMATLLAACVSLVAVFPASAECTRLGFSVNDYGKEGPTNDAKSLLDKHIATKMAERGVKNYHTGKKDVTCELFLNFIIFDEHTCTAEATVCWDGSPLPKGEQAAASATNGSADKQTTGSIEKPASTPKPTEKKTVAKKLDVTPAKPAAEEKPSTAAAVAPPSDAKAAAKPEERYEAVKSDEAPSAMPGAPADLAKSSAQPVEVAPVTPSPSP